MTERKTLREVLEAERLERERIRALIRDVDNFLGKPEAKRGPLADLTRRGITRNAARQMQTFGSS